MEGKMLNLLRGGKRLRPASSIRKEESMTDLELKKNVETELNWEPSVNPAEIGVSVKDGIVTLAGHIDSYGEKLAAERAAARVSGVKAVVNELEVRLPGSSQRTDEDIARCGCQRPQLVHFGTGGPDQSEGVQRLGHPRRQRGPAIPEGGGRRVGKRSLRGPRSPESHRSHAARQQDGSESRDRGRSEAQR